MERKGSRLLKLFGLCVHPYTSLCMQTTYTHIPTHIHIYTCIQTYPKQNKIINKIFCSRLSRRMNLVYCPLELPCVSSDLPSSDLPHASQELSTSSLATRPRGNEKARTFRQADNSSHRRDSAVPGLSHCPLACHPQGQDVYAQERKYLLGLCL